MTTAAQKSGQPTWHLLALARFIERRLDEDEATALHVLSDYAQHAPAWDSPSSGVVNVGDPDLDGLLPLGDGPLAHHIAHHDPRRVLRFVEAGRCMLDNYRGFIERIDAEEDWQVRERLALTRHGLDMWAHQYATLWADHPEYEDSFRP